MNLEGNKDAQRARKRVRFADQPKNVPVQLPPLTAGHGLKDARKEGLIIDEAGSVRASMAEFGEHVLTDDFTGGVDITTAEGPLTGFFRTETAVLQPHASPRSFEPHIQLTGTSMGIDQNPSSLGGNNVEGKTSLAIVPYTGQGSHRLLSPSVEEQYDAFSILHTAAGPHHMSQAFRGLPGGVRLAESSISSESSGSQEGGSRLLARFNDQRGRERRSKWMIVSAEQVKHTAEKLRDQAEKNKVLESAIEGHKRERILIYDAAMKQASNKEEEGINDAKLALEREQSKMRAEVDQELRKIGDLYQERCRDYATMVSDDCEASISKAVADLRKDWAQQKKTIDELVQCGGEEDRQVSVIATAVVEQLQEEKREEIAALRAETYSEVKMEFESREAALRDALQSDYQADLDGQLLLEQIRHQKEMDRLRVELGGGKVCIGEQAAGTVYTNGADTRCEGAGESRSGDSSSTRTPSISRRPVRKQMNLGTACTVRDSGWAAISSAKKPGLGKKLPVFKTPVQKLSPDIDNRKGVRRMGRSTSKSVPPSRTPSIGSRATTSINRSTVQDDDTSTTPTRNQEVELDGDLTGALIVSPTTAIPGVVTPTMGIAGRGSDEESSRPKKRAKRLFSTACS